MSFEFFFTALLFRSLDLITTWLVSPGLERELNPLMRRMGWRLAIILSLLLAGTCAFLPAPFCGGVCLLSLAAAGWNMIIYCYKL